MHKIDILQHWQYSVQFMEYGIIEIDFSIRIMPPISTSQNATEEGDEEANGKALDSGLSVERKREREKVELATYLCTLGLGRTHIPQK